MKINKIVVLGGTGFVGQHLVASLASQGYRIRVLSRHRERHRPLLVLPSVEVVEADVHDQQALQEEFQGCDAAINLAGILKDSKRHSFESVHVNLPRKVVQACLEAGVTRLLHMSALNADSLQGRSRYLRTKGQGEDLVHQAHEQGLAVTSFRPAVIFGPDDHFFNQFALLLSISPFIFPLACPTSRLAPVYVGDVVKAFDIALRKKDTIAQRYELCGPQSFTLKQLVELTARVAGLRRRIVALGELGSRIQARLMGQLPGKLFTWDNYLSLQTDGVCKGPFPPIFDLVPQSVEALVPSYLGHGRQRDRYHEHRRHARHE